MSNDYSNYGFDFKSQDDAIDFTYAHADKAEFFRTAYGEYGRIEISPDMELWYYGDENGVNPQSLEMWHKSGCPMKLSDCCWISFPQDHTDSVLLYGFLDEGSTGFPLNIEIVNAPEFVGYDEEMLSGKECCVDFTLLAKDVTIYPDETSFYEANSGGMDKESCIPCGTFPLPGNEESFTPEATALLNGVVSAVHKMINPATGINYWHVLLDCLGMKFSAVIAEDQVKESIMPGNVLKGYYWISGKLLNVEK